MPHNHAPNTTINSSGAKRSPDQDKKILLVDDHPVILMALREMFNQQPDLSICGETGSHPEALEMVSSQGPDLVIVDISLDEGNGIELVKEITKLSRKNKSQLPVVVFSAHDESLMARRCFAAGARGFVNKQSPLPELLTAVRTVLAGEVYLSEDLAIRTEASARGDDASFPGLDKLSDRELQVFELIGQGVGTSQIAKRLGLSVKTIETYRENIKNKLQLNSGNELLRHAMLWVLDVH